MSTTDVDHRRRDGPRRQAVGYANEMIAPPAYGSLARTFHWTIAGLLLFQIPLAFYMVDQPLGSDKLANYATHKSIGLVLFTLTALRLAWRLTHPAPRLPTNVAAWQRLVARFTQFFLYALLFLIPLTGLLRSQSANFPVSFFGLFTVPTLVGVSENFSKGMSAAHEMQGTALLILISAHALAALHHHFVRKDDVLWSMLPLGRRRGSSTPTRINPAHENRH